MPTDTPLQRADAAIHDVGSPIGAPAPPFSICSYVICDIAFLRPRREPALPAVIGVGAMPISPYLDGFPLDAEAKRVMGIAFEMTCVALRVDRTSPIAEKAAKRIIERAKDGERNPERLCDDALDLLRGPPD